MKKITVILAVLFTAIALPVQAETPKTMVIIDNGIDTALSEIKNNIIYEVCVANYSSCPNKQNLMEGSGAATVTPEMYSNIAWHHGTKVASAAIQADPGVKIIEIRCASLLSKDGYIGCNDNMLKSSLDWVIQNTTKFNIGIVVSPLGSYSATCKTSASYVSSINKLIESGIPVAFPTGNDFKYTGISTPACIPGVLAISAIDDKGRLALYANYSTRVDFADSGNLNVLTPGGKLSYTYGTSLSVASFGSKWLKIKNLKGLSYQDQYNLIKKTGTNYTNIMVKNTVTSINIDKALS
jgi:hypothetical protein